MKKPFKVVQAEIGIVFDAEDVGTVRATLGPERRSGFRTMIGFRNGQAVLVDNPPDIVMAKIFEAIRIDKTSDLYEFYQDRCCALRPSEEALVKAAQAIAKRQHAGDGPVEKEPAVN